MPSSRAVRSMPALANLNVKHGGGGEFDSWAQISSPWWGLRSNSPSRAGYDRLRRRGPHRGPAAPAHQHPQKLAQRIAQADPGRARLIPVEVCFIAPANFRHVIRIMDAFRRRATATNRHESQPNSATDSWELTEVRIARRIHTLNWHRQSLARQLREPNCQPR